MPRLATLLGACAVVLGAATGAFHAVAPAGPPLQAPAPGAADGTVREAAYRDNNLGVAWLEQYDYERAAASFRSALAQDPRSRLARVNLVIALYYLRQFDEARSLGASLAAEFPREPRVPYVLALVARAENRTDDAARLFRAVLAIDPRDAGALVNLGQVLVQLRQLEEGIALFRQAIVAEPANATALYGLATALTRAGRAAESAPVMARFESLRQSGAGTTFSNIYLEQGRYAEASVSSGAEPELVDETSPAMRFEASSPLTPAAGAAPRPTLADLDRDGDLDLLVASSTGVELFENADGTFRARPGSRVPGVATGVAVADADGDATPDLAVVGPRGLTVLVQRSRWTFTPVDVPPMGGPIASAAFADVDHDGDVDLVVGAGGSGGTPDAGGPCLLRNDGSARFAALPLGAGPQPAAGIVATDYDNHRDIDLLLVSESGPPRLLANQRDGTFKSVSAAVGVEPAGHAVAVAAADFNKDDVTDFVLGRANAPAALIVSDGTGGYRVEEGPASLRDATAVQAIDFDGDGLVDVVGLTRAGARLVRNLGTRWVESDALLPAAWRDASAPVAIASGDVDGDGDPDLVVAGPGGDVQLVVNRGGESTRRLRVDLTGRVSNRLGVGAKVEMRAGSLRQKLEVYASTPAPAQSDATFGLGPRERADVVRVLWPSGTVQAEAVEGQPRALTVVGLTELDRKPSSCPFLYTWNGSSFDFVTDFLGGGEMGYLLSPGQHSVPDPDEYVRVPGERLVERDGRYDLRVTNELEETLYLDAAALVAVTHPANVDVYPNEGLVSAPPAEPVLYVVRHRAAPLSATEDSGRDVLERLAREDRSYADTFETERIRGYARPHSLTLDLGEVGRRGGRTLLLLTGWTGYAFSSDNVAASQAGLALHPPSLAVEDAAGRWVTIVDEIGVPVGRPQTVVVDLTGRFRSAGRRVRITTTMQVFWDRAVVADDADVVPLGDSARQRAAGIRVDRPTPAGAVLRWRGYSAERTPDGRGPIGYDYSEVSRSASWKLMPGRYTREGEVGELVAAADDRFVVSRPGDEIALAFDATAIARPVAGERRTFLLHASGYSKEMDVNSASPDGPGPLPFRGMSAYPYPAAEGRAEARGWREYVERYNTRVVPRMLPPIELAIPSAVTSVPRTSPSFPER